MSKQFFFIKLIAPRPTFAQDMNDEERTVMQEHISYWMGLTQEGTAVLFGPVFEPTGGYGMGVIEVADEQAAKEIMLHDPTILSNRNFAFEIHPMRVGMIRKQD